MSATVERPLRQRQEALAIANEIRTRRARLKADLRAGAVRVEDVIVDPPACLSSMWACDLLMLAPRVGRREASRMLWASGVWPMRLVGALTSREKLALVEQVRREAGR